MKSRFHLVPDNLSTDTVECLEQLLHEARAGHVLGIAFAVMLKERTFITDMTGECRRNPTFTYGIVAALLHKLILMILGG